MVNLNSQYLVKKSNNNHRQGCKDNIVERLKPIIVESLARKSSLECEPKLSECERQVLIEEVCDNLQKELEAENFLNRL